MPPTLSTHEPLPSPAGSAAAVRPPGPLISEPPIVTEVQVASPKRVLPPALPPAALPPEASQLSPYQRMALMEPVREIPLVTPPPAGRENVRIRLADSTDEAAIASFAASLRRLPGVDSAAYDARGHELSVVGDPSSLDAKALSSQAEGSGLEVRGQVLNLPLKLSTHDSTCGSCGYEIYKRLATEPGVEAIEVFVPVHSQLRLITSPGALTPEAVNQRIASIEADVLKQQ